MRKRETKDERRETLINKVPDSSAVCRLPSAVTILAFDFGTSKIGVAVGQTATSTAQALTEIKAVDGRPNADQLNSLLKEWQPQLLLVGLPLNMDGSPSELSRRAKKFGNRLKENYSINVEFMDERLSTFSAKGELLSQGQSIDRAESPVDSIAARLILESWFNSH